MAFNLLARSSDSPITTRKQNIVIAEIVIYSLIHMAQFSTRCMQEWRYWHHNTNKSIGRFRIADSALVLANSHPEKPMLIAESILQSVGLSPLLFEVSLVLLCGQSGETGPGNSIYHIISSRATG
ncbi:hypothetical protein N7516_004788 [Penicillium verrucosum]|uniref:uncharacterized protein n=1 Tax=Penicillium verrucosum TaxID=60171 RepID=UPI00254588D5|nr:uncharacterized protein N7516_004788 [Penicillium verrucosum]KAJ5944620.1 hypothetical protein N7516_004788 [Penicillium verrucosum]